MAKPRLSISRRFKQDPAPEGKVFPFHLNIPGAIGGQPVKLHPTLPISTEIIEAKNGRPKKYCIKAYCAPDENASSGDIKVEDVFWDRIDGKDVELELDVKVMPAVDAPGPEAANFASLEGSRNLALADSAPTTSFRTKSRYEDMPVDDP